MEWFSASVFTDLYLCSILLVVAGYFVMLVPCGSARSEEAKHLQIVLEADMIMI